MTTNPFVQQHPASVDVYIRHGWSLVPIPPGTKGPRTKEWNTRANALRSQSDLPPNYGIGLAHAYSGTMALDVDYWDIALQELLQHNINLQELYDAPDAVIIDSGRQGHGKLLYAMPNGLVLCSKKIVIDKQSIYDLRCATANGLTVQDVLPPSIHPDTQQPYRWAGRGNWTRLPTIPQPLLTLWQSLLKQDNEKVIATGNSNASWEEIRGALEYIPADVSREDWINVGMALHWAGSQTDQVSEALYLWNEWSALSSSKYPGERGVIQQWNSFTLTKSSAITIGTLFHIAKQHGWVRPMPDATALFSAIESPLPPENVHLGVRPPAPDIDLSLFPKILADRAQEVSNSVGCDPLVPLWAGLAAVCGVVDARTRLELMEGYKVPPVLWLMTLGDPADKKSPGSKPMLSVLREIEAEDRPRFKKDLLDWEAKEAAFASAKKSFLEFAASPEAMLGDDAAPMVPDLPPQPVPLKITVSDITSQKLVRHASERPRGLLCYLDEMNSWVRKMVDKASGEDRSSWVVSYESEPYEMDRVGAGSIHCDNLAVSIFGNIQPKVFRNHLDSLSADGLIQRFLPAVLRGHKTRLGEPVLECLTQRSEWDMVLRMVFGLPPITYKLSPEAYNEYRAFQQWYESAKQDERLLQSSDTFMTAFGKLEGTTGRLALLFHLIEQPFNPIVDADTIKRVVDLVKSYIIPAFRYALGEVAGVSSFDQWLADFIIHNCDKQLISLSEIKRSGRRQLEDTNTWQADQIILSAMYVLEQARWVLRTDDGTKENQHFAQWAINPGLETQFKGYRQQIIAAKQRQLDNIYRLSTKERKFVKGFNPDEQE